MSYRGEQISILVGRVTEIGERYIVLAAGTRVVLPLGHGARGLTIGANVTVRAVRDRGQYIAETITPAGE